MKEFNLYISLGRTESISDLQACLVSCITMDYMPSSFLSAAVVSWCAGAYHLSTALQGFSRSSRVLLDILWAFPSHMALSSDRFVINVFACTALLLCAKKRMNTVCNQSTHFLSLTIGSVSNPFTMLIHDTRCHSDYRVGGWMQWGKLAYALALQIIRRR